MSARRLPPGIRRRGKGFTYTWRDARVQQFSRKAGDTLDEAIAYKARIDAERLMGTFQANSKSKFADYAAQWVEAAPLKPQTRHRYRGIVHGHLIPAFGTLTLPKIHPQLVRVWMAEQTAGPLSRHPSGRTPPCSGVAYGQPKRTATSRPFRLTASDSRAPTVAERESCRCPRCSL